MYQQQRFQTPDRSECRAQANDTDDGDVIKPAMSALGRVWICSHKVPRGSGAAPTGLALHPGLHSPAGVPLPDTWPECTPQVPAHQQGPDTPMHRTHLTPADLLSPGGPDSHACLSSHPVLSPYGLPPPEALLASSLLL